MVEITEESRSPMVNNLLKTVSGGALKCSIGNEINVGEVTCDLGSANKHGRREIEMKSLKGVGSFEI